MIGERWNLLIVRSALLGAGRYDEFLRRVPISRNVLAGRLGSSCGRDIHEEEVAVRRAR